ncbi:FbpB family small basic protein [Bacillus sp. V3B]|nr:FbpB family small basic protein [Bacillus sp. V3B]MCQ6276022.1 FbpB family small basic protein [Bacillus sp. V3B]
MTKRKKRSFTELVKENKLLLLRNQAAMERIEERLEKRHLSKEK